MSAEQATVNIVAPPEDAKPHVGFHGLLNLVPKNQAATTAAGPTPLPLKIGRLGGPPHLGAEVPTHSLHGEIAELIQKFGVLEKIDEAHHKDEHQVVHVTLTVEEEVGEEATLQEEETTQAVTKSSDFPHKEAPQEVKAGESEQFTMTTGDRIIYKIGEDSFALAFPDWDHHPSAEAEGELTEICIETKKTERKTCVKVKTDYDTEVVHLGKDPQLPAKKGCHESHHDGESGAFSFRHKDDNEHTQECSRTKCSHNHKTHIYHRHLFAHFIVHK
ncbi:hypothetical protein DRE_02986 [Drechslerella stenobrocha 248]|uniref:Uncharacterized protein n=1 Tax=Drechslerella stenobrocha 248 TaxID=1043628 RepID=W7HUA9_9PEZI|nr:hypothetical protein DRE_02986 [Drechslerella stenobrocha 248]